METIEQIRQALSHAGEPLVFEFGDISGIPGEDISYVLGKTSPQEIALQKFSFQISSEDIIENNISRGMTFQYVSFGYSFTFKVDKITKGIVGWSELQVSIEGIENV